MKTFKQQLTDIVTSVFDNEDSFITNILGYEYDECKSVEEFYMSGECCRVVLLYNYVTPHTRMVNTQDVLDWYEELKEGEPC